MTNLEDLSKSLDDFVCKVRTVIGLERLGKTETTDNVMIYEVGCIGRSSCFTRTNFRPSSERIDRNTNILETKLISWKRTGEINSPMCEDVKDCNCVVWKPLPWARTCISLAGNTLYNVSTDKLVHQGKPKTRGKNSESAFYTTVTSTIVCKLKGLFTSSICIFYFTGNTTTFPI